jgi:hypothetical protein
MSRKNDSIGVIIMSAPFGAVIRGAQSDVLAEKPRRCQLDKRIYVVVC